MGKRPSYEDLVDKATLPPEVADEVEDKLTDDSLEKLYRTIISMRNLLMDTQVDRF